MLSSVAPSFRRPSIRSASTSPSDVTEVNRYEVPIFPKSTNRASIATGASSIATGASLPAGAPLEATAGTVLAVVASTEEVDG